MKHEARELIDMELDAVSGGFLNFDNIVLQSNAAQQVGAAVGGAGGIVGNGGSATVAQLLGQANVSSIG
jgi:hypothetical protein